jgi:hypothetical protein
VDEIPRSEIIAGLRQPVPPQTPIRLGIRFFYYHPKWAWLQDNGSFFMWKHPEIVSGADLKAGVDLNQVRHGHPPPKSFIPDAGWHLSYFGGVDGILRKIRYLAHQENNIPEFTERQRIIDAVTYGFDLFNRDSPHGNLGSNPEPNDVPALILERGPEYRWSWSECSKDEL